MLEAFSSQLVVIMLMTFRLSGLLVFAPVIAGQTIPVRIKAMLCLMLAVCMIGLGPTSLTTPEALTKDVFTLALAITAETLLGVGIGLLALVPVLALQMGGVIISQQIGLTLASTFNPSLEVESDVVADLIMTMGTAAFLALGGLEAMLIAVAQTFKHVPPGAMTTLSLSAVGPVDFLELFKGFLSAALELAIRISAPVAAILLLETIVSSVLAKTIPQFNISTIGYGIKVLLGILALILAMHSISDAMIAHLTSALADLVGLTNRPASPGPLLNVLSPQGVTRG